MLSLELERKKQEQKDAELAQQQSGLSKEDFILLNDYYLYGFTVNEFFMLIKRFYKYIDKKDFQVRAIYYRESVSLSPDDYYSKSSKNRYFEDAEINAIIRFFKKYLNIDLERKTKYSQIYWEEETIEYVVFVQIRDESQVLTAVDSVFNLQLLAFCKNNLNHLIWADVNRYNLKIKSGAVLKFKSAL